MKGANLAMGHNRVVLTSGAAVTAGEAELARAYLRRRCPDQYEELAGALGIVGGEPAPPVCDQLLAGAYR